MPARGAAIALSFLRSRQSKQWIEREGGGLAALTVVLVLVLSALPLGQLIITAIAPRGTLDVSALSALATDEVARATWNTLVVGIGSAALALLIGTALALLLATSDLPGKAVIAFVFVFSLMIAPQVAALAFKTLAGPASPLLKAIGLAPPPGTPNPMLGPIGIILVMGLHHAPLAAITLAPGFVAVPRAVIEAASLDGAKPTMIIQKILLPLLRPYILAAALVTLVAGIGNFGIPALLGLPVSYQTLPTLVFQKIASFGPSMMTNAAAVSLLIAALSGAGVVAAALANPRDSVRLDADAIMTPFCRLERWRWPLAMIVWIGIAVAVALPLLSLIAASLVPAYGVNLSFETLTFGRFYEVLVRQEVTLRAFRNSLLLAGCAAIVLAMIAVPLAYAIERCLGRWRAVLVVLIEMPYALPGLVLAIACILLFLKPLPILNVSIYATPWIILFAYAARFLPLALKPTLAAMATVGPDQEEAAAVFGARLGKRLRHVILPRLLAPAVAGALLVFLLAFNELTVSALLWSAGTETLGVALLSLEDAGLASEAAAIGVTATAIVVVLMLLLDRLAPLLPADVLPWRLLAPRSSERVQSRTVPSAKSNAHTPAIAQRSTRKWTGGGSMPHTIQPSHPAATSP